LELILRAYAKNTTTLLGTLTHASDKKIRVHFNGPGEGSFTINRHDSQAAWCAPGNYVRAYLNSTANPVFGFFLEDGGDELVSPDEEGGEDLTRHGRGGAAVLEDAIIDATGSRATKEGTWVWTDSTMGAIAANLIDDAQAAGFLPMLTYDFSSGADTNGASWDVFDGQYELPVGLDLLEAIQRLQSAGFIVRVSHDFVMSAYKTIGTDRSGSITFQAAVNISEAAEREIRGSAAKSRMLVQGTTRNGTLKFVWATDSAVETALGRPKAGFVNYAASASDTVLGRVGAQAIRRLKKRFDGLSSLGVLEDEFVPFTDYFPGDTVTVTSLASTRASMSRLRPSASPKSTTGRRTSPWSSRTSRSSRSSSRTGPIRRRARAAAVEAAGRIPGPAATTARPSPASLSNASSRLGTSTGSSLRTTTTLRR
jgi:hypothetical protein